MKTKITILVSLLLLLLLNPQLTCAQTATGAGETKQMQPAAAKEEKQATRLTNLRTRAGLEINRRVASLNKLITKIGGLKRLTADQKSSLTIQVQTEITNLNTIKTKIDADSDLETLKTDTKSIVTSYRVYALFMPKIEILAASDMLIETSDKISSIAAKLQTKVDEAKVKGKDVTALQTTISDIQGKIADAKTQAQNAQNAVIPLTPDGYPGNKATLQSARAMLVAGRKDLEAIRLAIKTVRLDSQTFRKTASPEASTTTR